MTDKAEATDLNKMEPMMSISNGGVSIISEDVAIKIAKKNLSPSLINSLKDGCPASWVTGAFVIPLLVPQDDDNPATRGQLFHKVMEVVFELAPEERSREKINSIILEVIETEEFSLFKDNKDALAWLDDAVDGYYRMGGKPEKVQVASYKRAGEDEDKIGLEVFVKGKLGNAKRETLGFIDRLAVDQKHEDEDGVIIEDWKTGAKAKVWNPKTKSTEGLSEARQQVIYSMLLKQSGVNVTGARLIYPVAGKVVPVEINDEEFNKKVIEDINDTDEALTTMIENNLFEYKPSILCNWCPLRSICPAAQTDHFPKAAAARKKQPSIEVLAPGFDFL